MLCAEYRIPTHFLLRMYIPYFLHLTHEGGLVYLHDCPGVYQAQP